MGKNKSFSRDLYFPLQKQIHITSILPNGELLKQSIIRCGGTFVISLPHISFVVQHLVKASNIWDFNNTKLFANVQ